jgi:CDP-glycerol glycerophosphotransferase
MKRLTFNIFYARGFIYYNKKNFIFAEEQFKKALNYAPIHPKCNFKLGLCYFKLKKWEDAEVYLQKAVNLIPSNQQWKSQLIQTQKHLGKEIKSIAHLERENYIRLKIEKNPNDYELYSQLAIVLQKHAKWWQEVEALKKAIEDALD